MPKKALQSSRTRAPLASGSHPVRRAGSDAGVEAWAGYRDNLARHLIGIARHLQSKVMRALSEEDGHAALRLSFGPLITLVTPNGRALGTLASELGISKQACSQLAKQAEDAGYVDRSPNPQDGRSKVVSLTSSGRALTQDGARCIARLEASYAESLGAEAYAHFVECLAEMHSSELLRGDADPSNIERPTGTLALLPLVAERIQRWLMQATLECGHPGLKMSHGQVLPLIGPGGGRIHAIARLQEVSKQAISTITQDLEELGYVERVPDPRDGRGVVVSLTPNGEALLADSVASVERLGQELARLLGRDRAEALHVAARELYDALQLEAAIFDEPGPRQARTVQRSTSPRARERAPSPDLFSTLSPDRVRDPDLGLERLAAHLRRELGPTETHRLAIMLGSTADDTPSPGRRAANERTPQ